jgi:hypothetical protein
MQQKRLRRQKHYKNAIFGWIGRDIRLIFDEDGCYWLDLVGIYISKLSRENACKLMNKKGITRNPRWLII